MNSGIEPGVEQVDQEIHENKDEGDEQDQCLGHRVVAMSDRFNEQHADTV
jgi:hypothetical protein